MRCGVPNHFLCRDMEHKHIPHELSGILAMWPCVCVHEKPLKCKPIFAYLSWNKFQEQQTRAFRFYDAQIIKLLPFTLKQIPSTSHRTRTRTQGLMVERCWLVYNGSFLKENWIWVHRTRVRTRCEFWSKAYGHPEPSESELGCWDIFALLRWSEGVLFWIGGKS